MSQLMMTLLLLAVDGLRKLGSSRADIDRAIDAIWVATDALGGLDRVELSPQQVTDVRSAFAEHGIGQRVTK